MRVTLTLRVGGTLFLLTSPTIGEMTGTIQLRLRTPVATSTCKRPSSVTLVTSPIGIGGLQGLKAVVTRPGDMLMNVFQGAGVKVASLDAS